MHKRCVCTATHIDALHHLPFPKPTLASAAACQCLAFVANAGSGCLHCMQLATMHQTICLQYSLIKVACVACHLGDLLDALNMDVLVICLHYTKHGCTA